MSYTQKDVDDAAARIRSECPTAHISRGNYDLNLAVAKSDKSEMFIVYDSRENHPTVIGDVDAIIAALKDHGEQ